MRGSIQQWFCRAHQCLRSCCWPTDRLRRLPLHRTHHMQPRTLASPWWLPLPLVRLGSTVRDSLERHSGTRRRAHVPALSERMPERTIGPMSRYWTPAYAPYTRVPGASVFTNKSDCEKAANILNRTPGQYRGRGVKAHECDATGRLVK